ncbi:MAG: PDZ domain-containing protein [Acidobacteria bacterium]|nr:PDZ domain-containing protein [Acidobacteriota bacterium]MBI3427073.1 PDZ domain-containing protein [Acidobacteriota bacterium]
MQNIRLAGLFLPAVFFSSLFSLLVAAQTAVGTPVTPAYGGKVRAYLGVFLGDAPDAKGAIVGKVVEDSPAAKAGLRVNDILLSFAKTEVENAAHVYKLLGEIAPGSALPVTILRGGATLSLQVTLGERQGLVDACQKLYAEADLLQAEADRLRKLAEEARQKGNEEDARKLLKDAGDYANEAAKRREGTDKEISAGATSGTEDCRRSRQPARPPLGLSVLPLSEQLAQFFKVKTGAGLLITEVKPASLAERNKLQAGDCLLAVNGKPLTTLAELQRLLSRIGEPILRSASAEAAEITLLIVRDGVEKTLPFKL